MGLSILLLLTVRHLWTSGPQQIHLTGPTMGTTYSVKVVTARGADVPALRRLIQNSTQQRLESVDAKMSTYRTDSELSRFNASTSTEPFPISEETFKVFQAASEVAERSGGAFDVTVGPLVNAWGFGPEGRVSSPSEDEVRTLRLRVGHEKLLLLPETHSIQKIHPELYCDLSAIAKGYAVDRVAEALMELELTGFFVEIGGEVRTGGLNAQGLPWRIGIEEPQEHARNALRTISLSGESLATSGDYRNYFEVDGKRISHTIDPRTGRPITHALASVSVIHEHCMLADAYATALMVLGPEEGYSLAQSLGLRALFLVRTEGEDFVAKSINFFME